MLPLILLLLGLHETYWQSLFIFNEREQHHIDEELVLVVLQVFDILYDSVC